MVYQTNEYFFQINDGYPDGLCRGFRAGILTSVDYGNLVQCETLDDLKMNLQSTDYGSFLANETAQLTVSLISDRLLSKFVDMFETICKQAVGPSAAFFEYMRYAYMIDNIVLLITGTLHGRDISELIPKCHPLGMFEEMGSIAVATTPAELYNSVLVDTPLAPYFMDCVSEQDLDEMNIEIIRNTLYKAYLEDFTRFCNALGGETARIMSAILGFEADRRAFIITINSFGTELSKDDRAKLYPTNGKLHPDGLAKLAACDDYDQVRAVADGYAEYRELFEAAGTGVDKTIEDRFYEGEVQLCKEAFLSHFHYGSYYALVRLREQESRNIVWIAECISQRQRSKIDNYIPIY